MVAKPTLPLPLPPLTVISPEPIIEEPLIVFKSVPDTAAAIAVPSPFNIPVIEVEIVRAGVAPPDDEPAKPLAEATETAVTVP